MLDPHLRLPLKPITPVPSTNPESTGLTSTQSKVSTTYSATFRLPDRHGVFSFLVDFRRPRLGWSYVREKTVVPVTPPRHNEYPRFITGASVYYYGGALSTSVGFLVFVFIWLSVDFKDKATKDKKKA